MKIFTGHVIDTKMTNTATVEVERVVAHPVYKKRIRKVKKYHVHDEIGAEKGQIVHFVASKPYSKLKKWKIIEVVIDAKDKKVKAKDSKDSTQKNKNTKTAVNKKKGKKTGKK